MNWTVVESKRKSKFPRTVKKCLISKSLDLHVSLNNVDLKKVNINKNDILEKIIARITRKIKPGYRFKISIFSDQQYKITVKFNSEKMTIVNQQYLRRDISSHKVRHVPINNRKVCIYWK